MNKRDARRMAKHRATKGGQPTTQSGRRPGEPLSDAAKQKAARRREEEKRKSVEKFKKLLGGA